MSSPSRPPSTDRVTITVPRWFASLRDSGVRAFWWLAAAGLAGCVLMALSWKGAAATPYVPLEMPYLMSGTLIGLAMLGVSMTAISIHLGRREAALHREAIDELVRDVGELAERLQADPSSLRRRRRRRRTRSPATRR